MSSKMPVFWHRLRLPRKSVPLRTYHRILELILLSLSVKRKVLLFKCQTDVWTLLIDRCSLLHLVSSLVLGGAIASVGNHTLAQITPDTTLGSESSVVTPNAIVKGVPADLINGGAIRNTNLFHSFSQFNVGNGQRVYFANPAGIENIVTRVTGTNPSSILGTLGVNGGANVFLLNPNGIIFGPNARLDVGGSFVASTANSLVFNNGFEFSTTNPEAPSLLTISVPLGLQYGGNAGSIQVQNSKLQVPNGKTLALVGGNVQLNGGILLAPGGRVELGGLAGAGTVGLFVDGSNLSLSYPDTFARANVSLNNGSAVNVRAEGGGNIAINAQNLNLSGGSFLRAGIAPGLGSVDSKAGDIEINATGLIDLTDSSFMANTVPPETLGQGGSINITTRSLSLNSGSQLGAITFGRGDAGSVNINAQGTVSLDGVNSDGIGSGLLSTVESGAVGNGGSINITTGSLSLTNGAQLQAYTKQRGNAGSININARNTVSFDGGLAGSYVDSGANGNGGNINITTGSLSLKNGAQLSVFTNGQGDAGSVNINAYDTVSFDGVNRDNPKFSSGVISIVDRKGLGNGGNINITTGSLSLTNGAEVNANTRGTGNAGGVTIEARDVVFLDGKGNNQNSTAIGSQVETGAVGNGGNINITTGSLSAINGASLSASTLGQGDAGSVNINARDTVSFDGEDSNRRFGRRFSGAFSNVNPGAEGNGGSINITTESLSVTNGAALQTATYGQGNAGSVTIAARDTVSFNGVGSATGFSSGVGSFVSQEAVGNSGSINLTTGSLFATNGAVLTASTSGQGNAGSVNINARDTVSFDGVGSNGFSSGAYSIVDSTPEAVGNSGDINIKTRSLSVTNGAVINASTLGQGNGGNISLNINTLQTLNGGQVLTTSLSSGYAGNIILNATDSVTLAGSDRTYNARQAQFFAGIGGLSPASGVFANTSENSTGQGGDLRISTRQLIVRDSAEVNVSSEGSGNAGSLTVNAGSIKLNNQGRLLASTASGEGGNINLQVQDLILMRRNSLISAKADNNGNGGNITINAPFIVAVSSENSDIVADAIRGQGGNIKITAQGIYGLKYRPQLTTLSDINASSQFGVNGVVTINTPDVDPSRGLTELPVEPVNVEVTQGCQTAGKQTSVAFFNTGRGGLAPNPYEPISSSDIWEDVPSSTQRAENPASAVSASASPTPPPDQLVEAQGWIVNQKGEVTLVAEMPATRSQSRCRLH